jgi:hypothetical protein
VLDFGGGVGDISIRLAEKGLNVTYAEVKGRNKDFATWLFHRRQPGNRIEVLDIETDEEKIWLEFYSARHRPGTERTLFRHER